MSDHGKYHDRRGVPIYPGDLIKSDHFRERNGRRHYLYHTVVDDGTGILYMVPTAHLEPTKVAGGGRCRLMACVRDYLAGGRMVAGGEVIAGCGPGECLDHYDRPRVRVARRKQEQTS